MERRDAKAISVEQTGNGVETDIIRKKAILQSMKLIVGRRNR